MSERAARKSEVADIVGGGVLFGHSPPAHASMDVRSRLKRLYPYAAG
jgi:hypothetical protein